jgi:ATP-dependent DNA helicase RecG
LLPLFQKLNRPEKPVYLLKRGLPKGAFRRIGSTDQKCTDEDIALFYQLRSHRTYDETPLPEASLDDFDPNAIAEYRRARSQVNPNAAELNYTDEDLLYALAATTKHQKEICPTLAGINAVWEINGFASSLSHESR